MTVYVDDWRQRARIGRINAQWSHLTADTINELHLFADRLGLRRNWFQPELHNGKPTARWHYDVTESKRLEAIQLGALAITWREAGRRLRYERDALIAEAVRYQAEVSQ